jgi:hypothetical protein
LKEALTGIEESGGSSGETSDDIVNCLRLIEALISR